MRCHHRFAPILTVILAATGASAKTAAPANTSSPPAGAAASAEADYFGLTPLMLAAEKGDSEAVQALLDKGADVNATDKHGMTALMWATPQAGLLLLQHGARISVRDRFGRTPLHFAAFSGAYSGQSLVTALLARGAAIDARDDEGWTPLNYAVYAELRYWELGPHPKERDVALIAMKSVQPWALLSLNIQDAVRAGKDSIHTLLAHGAAVDAADRNGWTPLMHALWEWEGSDSPVIQALLAGGASVNVRAADGLTPLMACAHSINNTSTLKLFLDRGAKVNAADDSGYTALTYAAMGGDVEMAKLHLDRGANVNGGRATGGRPPRCIPLTEAVLGRKKELVQFLIQAGADVSFRDKDGITLYGWTQRLTAGTPEENAEMKTIGEILKQAGARE